MIEWHQLTGALVTYSPQHPPVVHVKVHLLVPVISAQSAFDQAYWFLTSSKTGPYQLWKKKFDFTSLPVAQKVTLVRIKGGSRLWLGPVIFSVLTKLVEEVVRDRWSVLRYKIVYSSQKNELCGGLIT